jgi:bacterial leucyl aminopeptidase
MVAVSRLAVFGVVLPLALAAVSSEPRPATELRLVKISEEDPGTWMTEEEKFEKLTSKRIGFMDITDTMVCLTKKQNKTSLLVGSVS